MQAHKQHSVKTLSEIASDLSMEDLQNFCKIIESDERKSVQKLLVSLHRRIDKHEQAKLKLTEMSKYEQIATSEGYVAIAGIDEVGRGPLIGPVVTAAVVLDMDHDWTGIDDSKKLSEARRNYYYHQIIEHSKSYAVGMATAGEIDEINILNATKLAMLRAIEKVETDYLLIDALTLPDISIQQKAIIKGDSKSISIAAASILAKVTRDRMMTELHELFPAYDFINNKGYGTDKHYQAIRQFGLLEEHRRTFLKDYV